MKIVSGLTLVQEAMRRIGAIPILSFDDDGPAAGSPQGIYESQLEFLFSAYPWKCGKKTAALVRLADAPVRAWDYGYMLPAERVGPPRAFYDSKENAYNLAGGRPLTAFQVEGSVVNTDTAECYAEYPVIPEVTAWPGYLKLLGVNVLMVEYALSIREDRQLRGQLYNETYGDPRTKGETGMFGEAMNMDTQSEPALGPPDGGRNPVHNARYMPGDVRSDWEY